MTVARPERKCKPSGTHGGETVSMLPEHALDCFPAQR